MKLWTEYKTQTVIALVAAILFIPFIGNVHLFDWDEVNFAECAREMIETGKYFSVHINYIPFWEKPPLFFWLQAMGMHMFGIGEFASRLPNAICGVFTLVILYNIGKRLFGHVFGLIWVFAYGGSVLPHFYFRSGIIDPVLNLFIFLGLYYFILSVWKYGDDKGFALRRHGYFYLAVSGLFIGLGVMTKGPVALIIPCICFFVYWVLVGLRMYITIPRFFFFLAAVLVTLSLWYGVETANNGPWFMSQFITYQIRLFAQKDSGHGGFPGYHVLVLFLGCFPISVFALRGLLRQKLEAGYQQDFRRWMVILFWVVLILFTIVRTKIVHYSSMAYFPITFLGALTLYQIYQEKQLLRGWMKWLTVGLGAVLALPTLILPKVATQVDMVEKYVTIKDEFAKANFGAEVYWSGFEPLVGVFYLLLLAAVAYLAHTQRQKAFFLLFGGTALYLTMTVYAYMGRVEHYVQGALIEFLEKRQGEDCYVTTTFRSYAYLFYSRSQPSSKPLNGMPDEDRWKQKLLYEDMAKDVYVVAKINQVKKLKDVPGLEKLYAKNGFVFFKKPKTKTAKKKRRSSN